MAVYSITYNSSQIKDYSKLEQGVNAVSASTWIKPVSGQFIIQTTYTVEALLNALKVYIHSEDALFIAKLDMPHWVSRNLDKNLMASLGKQIF